MFKLAFADLGALDVPAEVGAEFETSEIDVTPARYRVEAITRDGAWVKRLRFVRGKLRPMSGIALRSTSAETTEPATSSKQRVSTRR